MFIEQENTSLNGRKDEFWLEIFWMTSSQRFGQEDKAQENSGVEIFAYKVGATQIKSILAPCHTDSTV